MPKLLKRPSRLMTVAAVSIGLLLSVGVQAASAALRWEGHGGFVFDGQGNMHWRAWLKGIPWGQSWERACRATPGLYNRVPEYCITDAFSGVMGVWRVPVSNGPYVQGVHWANFETGGIDTGRIRIDATLWDIPWGESWEGRCRVTAGIDNRRPDICYHNGSNIRGGWWLPLANGN